MRRYKTAGNTTLFDAEEKERKLTEKGDPLEWLSKAVDFEMFRSQLEDALLPRKRGSNAGAKRYDVVMMFKLMVLQRCYNLSDGQAEFQVVDSTSFRRFFGLSEGDSEESRKHKAHKKRHKDTEARWTQKGGVNCFGYKNHIKGDTRSKLILTQEVTPASVHDSQPTATLLEESDKGQPLFGDSAYVDQGETLEKYRMKDEICEKGYRGHLLTEGAERTK
jgi:hypothetical protein